MMRPAFMAAVLGVASITPALAEDFTHCRAIADDSARLACYDALAGRGKTAPAATPVVAPPAVPAATAAVPASAPGVLDADDRFGAENLKGEAAAKAKAKSTDEIHSRIVGTFDGWDENTRFTLENGQVWKVDEDGIRSYRSRGGPAVTIKKGVLGSYFMHFDEPRARVKVKRVR
jgi:hypothetical protein